MLTIGTITTLAGNGSGHFNHKEIRGFENDRKQLKGKYLSPFSRQRTKKLNRKEFSDMLAKINAKKTAHLVLA